jgi:Fur family transcriptional regulator, ferric uptake regulator
MIMHHNGFSVVLKEVFMSESLIKKKGLRVTKPRLRVISFFKKNIDNHFSAEQIQQQLNVHGKEVALATVYRMLTLFTEKKLLNKINPDGIKGMYEWNSGSHHEHFFCRSCESLFEFFDAKLEAMKHKVAQDNGFVMEDHELTIHGLCGKCHSQCA